MRRAPAHLVMAGLALAVACGGGGPSAKDATSRADRDRHCEQPDGRARALRAGDHSRNGHRDQRDQRGGRGARTKLQVIHVDARSDLNRSATAVLDVIDKGAQIVVPICDADFGAPGARAGTTRASWRSPVPTRRASEAGRRPAHVRPTPARRPRARSTRSTGTTCGAGGAPTGCATGWSITGHVRGVPRALDAVGGTVVGEDRSAERSPIAAQVTGSCTARSPTSSCSRPSPSGRPRSGAARPLDGPLILAAADSGTLRLKPTPHLSNIWVAAVGSSHGDDPRDP